MMKTELDAKGKDKEGKDEGEEEAVDAEEGRGTRAGAEAHALPTESWEPPFEGCVYAGTVGARAASRGAPS